MNFLDSFKKAKEYVNKPEDRGRGRLDEDEPSNEQIEKNARNKALIYVALWLMVIVIVCLIGVIYCNQVIESKTIQKYVEFSATLLSIVLSIFAIFYSYFSALEASRQWGDINTAVRVMERTTSTIETNNETLLATVIAIHGEVSALGSNTQTTDNTIEQNNTDVSIQNKEIDNNNNGK